MNSVTSTLTPSKMAPDCLEKSRKKSWKQTSASSTSTSDLKTKGQKCGTSKATSKPGQAPGDLLAKDINKLSMAEKQNPKRIHQLGKKIPQPRSQSLPLKCSGLADIADLILKNFCRKIIVMVGAGISTASGIPDFRTPGSGLYDNLKKYHVPYPEAIFDIDYFTYNPQPFFVLAKDLYPGKYKPNIVHYFLRLLHEKGVLLRCYTQNIDGLERMAGIPPEKLVEAHGTFSTASCHLCYTPFPAKEAQDCIMNGDSPRCNVCYGVVKPDIVFFGEDLPKSFHNFSKDFPKADLLIVMGTSLEIEPFANMVNAVRLNVPRLLMNRDLVGPFKKKPLKSTDVAELGELCDVTRTFVSALNWQTDLEELMRSQKF
ncbi:NAD-dependent protein deacetylase sirtuin-3-like isoform X2 [Hyla sarda]|nr:NAD-dependent protein deacetylase sirtuin-3-like isoform X2 [Hyla sarda]XP_056373278.1 NAD-dependent protein deacetylase sirtuin-3-like isoform X2 [Hyla sarda]XP_056373279.1 NAD-dependent protein deacetylase sirtuin-3-like isoform X2 [Hyla sarda]XP_056373280.1 NAD-dependent protein deacetylase sirtuin-3-like isoform X2 [Hyla sarda]